jgi:hypothetical protein
MDLDWTVKEAGRERLKAWLPEARRDVEQRGPALITPFSGVAKAMVPYINEDNFDALLIYPGPKGGWHADLMLKSVPPGLPNVLGSPKQSPLATRSDAVEMARSLLEMALAQAKLNRDAPTETPPPAFELYDWSFELNPKGLEIIEKVKPPDYSPDRPIEFLEEVLAEFAPNGFDAEAFNTWPRKAQGRLVTALHLAALHGIFRYPLNLDKPPKEEAS